MPIAALTRGLALAVALLAATDLSRAAQGLPAIWWLGPGAVAGPLRLLLAGFAAAYAIRPQMRRPRMIASVAVVLVAAAIAGRDALSFFALLADGLETGAPMPLSAVTFALLVALAASFALQKPHRRGGWLAAVVAPIALAGFALGQMLTFGATRYARRADAVVVLGARVYADGTPSLAVADRVRTGCELVRAGHAPILVVSGGPGDGTIHETSAMKRLARSCGIDEDAIVVDRDGLSTWHTARNFAARFDGARVLAVSHGYHLPRVKLAFERVGVEAYTVPARETRALRGLPWYVTREIAAFWVYYLAPAA
jgi:uncharacterized SAM-binding protein YcdF (DUF218 family)